MSHGIAIAHDLSHGNLPGIRKDHLIECDRDFVGASRRPLVRARRRLGIRGPAAGVDLQLRRQRQLGDERRSKVSGLLESRVLFVRDGVRSPNGRRQIFREEHFVQGIAVAFQSGQRRSVGHGPVHQNSDHGRSTGARGIWRNEHDQEIVLLDIAALVALLGPWQIRHFEPAQIRQRLECRVRRLESSGNVSLTSCGGFTGSGATDCCARTPRAPAMSSRHAQPKPRHAR